jgi:hypothetical protein
MTFVEMLSPAVKDVVMERQEIIPDVERTFFGKRYMNC